jgi:sugar lactone lactonase YvrE
MRRLIFFAALTFVLAYPFTLRTQNGAPNSQPNPYRAGVDNWAKLPAGRTWGSTSAVDVDPQGHIWVAERCGANTCVGSTVDPVLEFDSSGNLLKSFGAGTFVFPHGIFCAPDGSLWLTDGQAKDGKGNQVFHFSADGKVLMTLGKAGVTGDGPDTFDEPNDVVIAPNGDIFVSDGHNPGRGNARVVKFSKDGKFIKQWGGHGSGPGQFEVPHALALDSQGRLFVGDRANNRIQIFDQDGNFITQWKQFGRPSGIFIDAKDTIYVTDSESQPVETHGRQPGYGFNPGWQRGIRIGSAKDGSVTAFIPDSETANVEGARGITTAAEGVAADAKGTVYGAEVGAKVLKVYVKK